MKKLTLTITLGLVMILAACASPVPRVNADEALDLMAEGAVLVDVRERHEHEEIRIPESMLISLSVIEVLAPMRFDDLDTVIVVYCRSGRRSAEAAAILVDLGFTNVYDLGGINAWPYETLSGPVN